MDRTQIENYKAEEKKLSELIYAKLGKLTILQESTTEFKRIYSEDMFIRPNSKAFIHVMHFLFTLYDINEFKKRFFWPLTDKQSESNFRTSAIEYLTYLKIKNNCEWINLNRSLVVMPGGYKFLLFLDDFLEFVAIELIKQRSKYLPKDIILKDLNCKTELFILESKAKIVKQNAAAYAESLDGQTKKYLKCTENLNNIFMEISRATKIPLKDLLRPSFINNLKHFVDKTFKNNVKNKIDNICNFEKYIDFIQENIQLNGNEEIPLYYDENNLVFNKDLDEKKIIKCNNTNLANLIDAIVILIPKLNKIISCSGHDSIETHQFQNEELKKLKNNTTETNQKITELLTYMQTGIKMSLKLNSKETSTEKELSSDFRAQYFETPPIRCNFNRTEKTRLPMLEDNLSMNLGTNCSVENDNFTFADRTTVINLSSPELKSEKHAANKENNSKIFFDPSEFLRSLSKKKQKEIIQSEKINSWDDGTPLKMIDSNLCEKLRPPKKNSQFNTKKKMFSDKFINTSQAFKKIQNTSTQIEKLSKSPTGKLGPLFEIDEISNILLSDCFEDINSNSLGNINIEPKIDTPAIKDKIFNKPSNKEKSPNKIVDLKFSHRVLNEDIGLETDLISIFSKLNINDESKSDDIFNTTDSVLNDIEM